MKVVQVTLRFDAPGGVETTVRETSRRLRAGGDDVQVFASDLFDEGNWIVRNDFASTVDGVPVRRFRVQKRLLPGLNMPLMIGLVDALAESDADVIHAHSHRYGHVLEAAAAAERTGIPLVVSTHYHPADPYDTPVRRGLLRVQDVGFGATAYRVARAVIVETEHEARLVREFAPSDRLRTVPPGIDLAAWSDPSRDAPAPSGLPAGYLLFAGRIDATKGLDLLLDALARLPPERRRPLVLLGPDWGERSRLEAQSAALGLTGLVRFLDRVDDPGVYRSVFRGARAFVLPSRYEAFGLVLLDAMAAGVPIVATSVGGVPEVLDGGRRGRLVPAESAASLAAALAEVEGDPDGTRRRIAAASEGVRGYDWSVTTERLKAIYREVAG